MTDYSWYSRENLEVAADGIRTEANKWGKLSDTMRSVANATADQGLPLSAFVVTDITGPVSAYDLQHAYEQMHSWLTQLFKQGETEMERFSEALKTVADWYEESDANSAETFDQIVRS